MTFAEKRGVTRPWVTPFLIVIMHPSPRQPTPTDPDHTRYTDRIFPRYRFVPGLYPHPRRNEQGHSFERPEPQAEVVAPDQWHLSETYLYGIDLYNFAYWWECHEELEALWHAVGHDTEQGLFLQGIVQIAAANLRRFMNPADGTAGRSLADKGVAKLECHHGTYMGIDVPRFRSQVGAYFNDTDGSAPTIDLHSPDHAFRRLRS